MWRSQTCEIEKVGDQLQYNLSAALVMVFTLVFMFFLCYWIYRNFNESKYILAWNHKIMKELQNQIKDEDVKAMTRLINTVKSDKVKAKKMESGIGSLGVIMRIQGVRLNQMQEKLKYMQTGYEDTTKPSADSVLGFDALRDADVPLFSSQSFTISPHCLHNRRHRPPGNKARCVRTRKNFLPPSRGVTSNHHSEK